MSAQMENTCAIGEEHLRDRIIFSSDFHSFLFKNSFFNVCTSEKHLSADQAGLRDRG
jgi:hypothetical protein